MELPSPISSKDAVTSMGNEGNMVKKLLGTRKQKENKAGDTGTKAVSDILGKGKTKIEKIL